MKSLKIITTLFLAMLLAVGNASAATTSLVVQATISSTSSITVTPATLDFGTITGSATTYRFRAPSATAVNVNYFAAGPYEIRVYTDNGVGSGFADKRGFIRSGTTAAADRLYLKAWCPNFNANKLISTTVGPTLATTSSYTDYLWSGVDLNGNTVLDEVLTSGTYSEATLQEDLNGDGDIGDSITATIAAPVGEGASLSWIRELDAQTEGDTVAAALTRCVLACNTAVRGDKSLANPFPAIFAVDIVGVKNGIYTSANNGTTPVTTGQTCVNGVVFELLIY